VVWAACIDPARKSLTLEKDTSQQAAENERGTFITTLGRTTGERKAIEYEIGKVA